MRVLAALGLYGGKVVHLDDGSLASARVVSTDPLKTARRWIEAGADGLHVVDLDAALGQGHNREMICRLVGELPAGSVQVGGGIRTREDLAELFGAGVGKAVLGSILVRAPEAFLGLCNAYPGRVLAGIDSYDREVRISGWTEGTAVGIEDVVLRAHALGACGVVLTDISREGSRVGPNVDFLQELKQYFPPDFELIASGGISSTDDLVVLKALVGVSAVVVGRALYDGELELSDAVRRLNGRGACFR